MRDFSHVISLGETCATAAMLDRLGLRRESHPIDWALSNPEASGYVLSRGPGFVEGPNPAGTLAHPLDCCVPEGRYLNTRVVYLHHPPSDPTHQSYILRCFERFDAAVKSRTPVLFVTTAPRHLETNRKGVLEFARMTRDRWPTLVFDVAAIEAALVQPHDMCPLGSLHFAMPGEERGVEMRLETTLDGGSRVRFYTMTVLREWKSDVADHDPACLWAGSRDEDLWVRVMLDYAVVT